MKNFSKRFIINLIRAIVLVFLIFWFLFTFTNCLTAYAEEQTVSYTIGDSKKIELPKVFYNVITDVSFMKDTIPQGERIEVLEEGDSYKCQYKGQIGYIKSSNIKKNELPNEIEILMFKEIDLSSYSNQSLTNAKIANAYMNGAVIQPNEEFDFFQYVGWTSKERGYLSAPAYSKGKKIYSMGGGICSLSSAIYNAVLDVSNIEITERRHHSGPVKYVPYFSDGSGRDATVSYKQQNFKFKNKNEFKIILLTFIEEKIQTTIVAKEY